MSFSDNEYDFDDDFIDDFDDEFKGDVDFDSKDFVYDEDFGTNFNENSDNEDDLYEKELNSETGSEAGEDYIMFEKEEVEYRAEIDVFDRVGLPGGIFIPSITNIRKSTPEARFINFVNSISIIIRNEFPKLLTDYEVEQITEKSTMVPYVQYKNPLGFILGYIVSNGSGKINKDRVKVLFNEKTLKELNLLLPTANITKPDIIRYGKLWKFIG